MPAQKRQASNDQPGPSTLSSSKSTSTVPAKKSKRNLEQLQNELKQVGETKDGYQKELNLILHKYGVRFGNDIPVTKESEA